MVKKMRVIAAFAVCSVILLAMITTGCAPSPNAPPPTTVLENNALATKTRTISVTETPTEAQEEAAPLSSSSLDRAQTPTAEASREAEIAQPTPLVSEEDTDSQAAITGTSQPPETMQPTPTPVELEAVQAQDCVNEAAFYTDVTIPDGTWFSPGAAFTKTWQIRNEGSCTWEGYTFVFAFGDVMSAPLANPLPVIAPNEVVDISIDMIAPTRGGEQTGNWEFQNAQGDRFGVGSAGADYIWVQINVEWQDAGNSQVPLLQPASLVATPNNCGAASNVDFESQTLSLINSGRAEQGLSPLVTSPALSSAAREHSQDMACQDFVDHNGSNGSTWYDRVSNQGYANANSARENIYVGNPAFGGTPAGAYAWWMNSPVHRDNILNPSISEIGIGYVYNQDSEYGGYYTVVFARP